MSQELFPAGVNTVGIAAFIAFLLCWLAGAISAIAGLRVQKSNPEPMSLWKAPMRKHFLRFLFFATAGLLCMGVAFAFGGWPTGYE